MKAMDPKEYAARLKSYREMGMTEESASIAVGLDLMAEGLGSVMANFAAALGESLAYVLYALQSFSNAIGIIDNTPFWKRDPLSIPPMRWEYQETMAKVWGYPIYALYHRVVYHCWPQSIKYYWEAAKEIEDLMEW